MPASCFWSQRLTQKHDPFAGLHDPTPAAPLALSASPSGPAACRPQHMWARWERLRKAHLAGVCRCRSALPQQLLQAQLPTQGPQRAGHGSRGCGAVRGKLAEVLLLEHFMSMGGQVLHLVGQPGSQGMPVRACARQHLQACSTWIRIEVSVKVCASNCLQSGPCARCVPGSASRVGQAGLQGCACQTLSLDTSASVGHLMLDMAGFAGRACQGACLAGPAGL